MITHNCRHACGISNHTEEVIPAQSQVLSSYLQALSRLQQRVTLKPQELKLAQPSWPAFYPVWRQTMVTTESEIARNRTWVSPVTARSQEQPRIYLHSRKQLVMNLRQYINIPPCIASCQQCTTCEQRRRPAPHSLLTSGLYIRYSCTVILLAISNIRYWCAITSSHFNPLMDARSLGTVRCYVLSLQPPSKYPYPALPPNTYPALPPTFYLTPSYPHLA